MAEFLKNEYRTTGKGFDFGDGTWHKCGSCCYPVRPLSVKWLQAAPAAEKKRRAWYISLLPAEITENKGLAEPDNGENSLSGFSSSGEEIINRHWAEIEKGILQFDEFMVHKCPDIAGVMLFESDKDKQTEYIKNSYRHGEYTYFSPACAASIVPICSSIVGNKLSCW